MGWAKPLRIEVFALLDKSDFNARYLHDWDASPTVQVTNLVVKHYPADELAIVIAHEVAHGVGSHPSYDFVVGSGIVIALGLSIWSLLAFARFIPAGQVWSRIKAGAVACLTLCLFAGAVGCVAAWNTQKEYWSDEEGLRLLIAGGWTADKAKATFALWLKNSPVHGAGSWYSPNRHPSDSDRRQRIQELDLMAQ
jgi:Zn-dependent protease with chaperone function